jgi:hypothetical protein
MGSWIGIIALVASAPAVCADARAQETSPPSADHARQHLHNYGDFDKTCMRWTDQCRICSRASQAEASICSNIGIACQPKQIECLEPKQAGENK